MRFGGHQTFYLREGWLYKGLELLKERPELLVDEFSFDHLGVGKNMASSLQHWLLATGLALRGEPVTGRRTRMLQPTALANLIWENDKYFSRIETLWLLHTNLVHNREHAESWYWFFNDFGLDRFDREICYRRLLRHVQEELSGSTPKGKTVERDLSCLLNTYAVDVPSREVDPEEDIWCPFRDLDLMVQFRTSGHIQMQRRRRGGDAYVFMYALERCLSTAVASDFESYEASVSEVRFFDLCRLANNPMRVFCLTTDAFFEKLLEIERQAGRFGLRIVSLAGERLVRCERRPAHRWAEALYSKDGVTV